MNRIEKLKEMLAEAKEDNFLQHALALEYIKAGDDTVARALFESILERDPGYIGSYYHLAKLLERTGEPGAAMGIYEKGMGMAGKAGDNHAFNELKMAKEELEDY